MLSRLHRRRMILSHFTAATVSDRFFQSHSHHFDFDCEVWVKCDLWLWLWVWVVSALRCLCVGVRLSVSLIIDTRQTSSSRLQPPGPDSSSRLQSSPVPLPRWSHPHSLSLTPVPRSVHSARTLREYVIFLNPVSFHYFGLIGQERAQEFYSKLIDIYKLFVDSLYVIILFH